MDTGRWRKWEGSQEGAASQKPGEKSSQDRKSVQTVPSKVKNACTRCAPDFTPSSVLLLGHNALACLRSAGPRRGGRRVQGDRQRRGGKSHGHGKKKVLKRRERTE